MVQMNERSGKHRRAAKVPKKGRGSRKRPDGHPPRPLNPYTLFFLTERERILLGSDKLNLPFTKQEVALISHRNQNKPKRVHRKTHGKIDLQNLTERICLRWQTISPSDRQVFVEQAKIEKAIYDEKVVQWKANTQKGLAPSCSVKKQSKHDESSIHDTVFPCQSESTSNDPISKPNSERDVGTIRSGVSLSPNPYAPTRNEGAPTFSMFSQQTTSGGIADSFLASLDPTMHQSPISHVHALSAQDRQIPLAESVVHMQHLSEIASDTGHLNLGQDLHSMDEIALEPIHFPFLTGNAYDMVRTNANNLLTRKLCPLEILQVQNGNLDYALSDPIDPREMDLLF